jgi:hypothetical protein
MKAFQTGFAFTSITLTNNYQSFRRHKTSGNKGNNGISYSSGKDPITGKKLPLDKNNYKRNLIIADYKNPQ